MTLRTSLFNRGIYSSTVKRYIWGSVLYAIALFLITALPILSSVNPEFSHWATEPCNEFLLAGEYLAIPLFFTLIVPTATALLVFRFVHSKRNTVFFHSLPVTRTANFISTILAAFTLMMAPVIFNGVILSVISLCGYSNLFNLFGVFVWVCYNLIGLFLMFSAATLVSFLTGNSFAAVGLNILIHIIALIIVGCGMLLASPFLYGYVESSELLSTVGEWNFVTYIMNLPSTFNRHLGELLPFSWIRFSVFAAFALLFFVLSWLLYKKRRTETAEDVAAYRVLNPIYKYLFSFLAAIGAFGIGAADINNAPLLPIALAVIIGAVVYFALEMILKKTLRVWGSYKGYLALLASVALCIFIFAGTTFFGFETRIPQKENIKDVLVRDHRPYAESMRSTESEEVIDFTLRMHKELTSPENRMMVKGEEKERFHTIYINYFIDGGKQLERSYYVTADMYYAYMRELFELPGYRETFFDVLNMKEENIFSADLNHSDLEALSHESIRELLSLVREDVLNMSYDEYSYNTWSKPLGFRERKGGDVYGEERYYININANFKKTIAWLREKGFADLLLPQDAEYAIVSRTSWDKYFAAPEETGEVFVGDSRVYEAAYSKETPKLDAFPDAKLISKAEEKKVLFDYLFTTPGKFDYKKEPTHYVCHITEDGYLNVVARIYG